MEKNFDQSLHEACIEKNLSEIAKLAAKANTSEKGRKALFALKTTIQEITVVENREPLNIAQILKLATIGTCIGCIIAKYSFPIDMANWLKAKNVIIEARVISASIIAMHRLSDTAQENVMVQLVPISGMNPGLWKEITDTFKLYICLKDGGLRNF